MWDFVAQAAGGGSSELLPTLLERLGTAAIVAALTIWWALTERKERVAAQKTIAEKNDDAIKREREFNEKERQANERERERAERLALVLHDAAETLAAVKQGMFAAIDRAQMPHTAADANLRRIELAADELTRTVKAIDEERRQREHMPSPPKEA